MNFKVIAFLALGICAESFAVVESYRKLAKELMTIEKIDTAKKKIDDLQPEERAALRNFLREELLPEMVKMLSIEYGSVHELKTKLAWNSFKHNGSVWLTLGGLFGSFLFSLATTQGGVAVKAKENISPTFIAAVEMIIVSGILISPALFIQSVINARYYSGECSHMQTDVDKFERIKTLIDYCS